MKDGWKWGANRTPARRAAAVAALLAGWTVGAFLAYVANVVVL